MFFFFFFFQAEDGIRDYKVTGVQTCALPICPLRPRRPPELPGSLQPCPQVPPAGSLLRPRQEPCRAHLRRPALRLHSRPRSLSEVLGQWTGYSSLCRIEQRRKPKEYN